MRPGDDVQDLRIPAEAKWLIGFWINQGSSMPKRTMGRRSNSRFGTWGVPARTRLAKQVQHIRHWKIIHGDYSDVSNCKATWFVDPPYVDQGKQYACKVVDYSKLAAWCRSRRGQVVVCESLGARWLPFRPVTTVAGSTHKITTEVIWHRCKG